MSVFCHDTWVCFCHKEPCGLSLLLPLNYFKSYGQRLAISRDWIARKVMIMPPICFSLSDHCFSFGWSMTSTAGNSFQCKQSFRGKDFAWEHSSLFRSESLVQITTFEQAIIYIFTPIHLGAREVVGKEWQLVTAVRSDTLWVTLIRLWALTLIVFIFLLLEPTKCLTFISVIVEISLQAHRNVYKCFPDIVQAAADLSFLTHLGLDCLFHWWQAVDFLDKLLRYDHQERLTAREAMVTPLLSSLFSYLTPLQSS